MRTYTHGIIGYLIYLKGTVQEKKLAVLEDREPRAINLDFIPPSPPT